VAVLTVPSNHHNRERRRYGCWIAAVNAELRGLPKVYYSGESYEHARQFKRVKNNIFATFELLGSIKCKDMEKVELTNLFVQ